MRLTPLGIDNDFSEKTLHGLVRPGTLARLLGISVKTIHKLVREGKLPCVQVTARERPFTAGLIRRP